MDVCYQVTDLLLAFSLWFWVFYVTIMIYLTLKFGLTTELHYYFWKKNSISLKFSTDVILEYSDRYEIL